MAETGCSYAIQDKRLYRPVHEAYSDFLVNDNQWA
jgi:hypothetical protein